MRRIRIIPTLLVDSAGGLVKTVRFGKRTYIGDPINAVKIFNDKGVDELVLLDIDASINKREPNYSAIEEIVSEAFMPIAYGGGVKNADQMSRLFRCGLEKVILGSSAIDTPELITEGAQRFGSQSIVVCLDVKKEWLGGYKVKTFGGSKSTGFSPVDIARRSVSAGAGEVIVYAIDRDGAFNGFDIGLIKSIASSVNVPVIACGGARNSGDIVEAVRAGQASAVAAGSMFVYQSSTRGVLISYPKEDEMKQIFSEIAGS